MLSPPKNISVEHCSRQRWRRSGGCLSPPLFRDGNNECDLTTINAWPCNHCSRGMQCLYRFIVTRPFVNSNTVTPLSRRLDVSLLLVTSRLMKPFMDWMGRTQRYKSYCPSKVFNPTLSSRVYYYCRNYQNTAMDTFNFIQSLARLFAGEYTFPLIIS